MFQRLSLQGPPRLVRSASPFGYDLPRYPPVACGVYIFLQSVLWETPLCTIVHAMDNFSSKGTIHNTVTSSASTSGKARSKVEPLGDWPSLGVQQSSLVDFLVFHNLFSKQNNIPKLVNSKNRSFLIAKDARQHVDFSKKKHSPEKWGLGENLQCTNGQTLGDLRTP